MSSPIPNPQSPISISGQTKVVGIFGDPIVHTRSPAMQNAAFRACNLPYIYVPFLVRPPELSRAVNSIRALHMVGANVTVPHKERILRHLDALSAEAEVCGAVNTVVNDAGVLFGENTDSRGFLLSLQEWGVSLGGREAIVLGAGGATRAVLVALIRAGSKRITVVNRTLSKARALIRTYHSLGPTQLDAQPLTVLQEPDFLQNASLAVNCTSIGLHGEKFLPFAYTATPSDCLFYDLLYGTELTSFLQGARRAHRPTRDGRRMLLHQGALAFSLWTGLPAPLTAMTRALDRALRSEADPTTVSSFHGRKRV